jgi:P-type conjugative transfer protein TrbJ
MSTSKSILPHSLFLALVLFASPSFAGGGATGGATEITQIMNNVELGIQSVQAQSQTMTQLSQYATQLQQHMAQIRNMQNLPANIIQKNLKPYQDQLDTVQALYSTYRNANSNLMLLRSAFKDASVVIDGLRLTPEQYVHNETIAAKRREGIYADAFINQKQVMANVQADFIKARDLAAQIPATAGVHESLSVTNSHLNLVSGQLSNLTQTIVDQQVRENALKESQIQSGQELKKIWGSQGQKEAAAVQHLLR